VKGIIVKIAKQYRLPVTMVIDTSHELDDGYSTVIVVDKARDSADIALINLVRAGDIVVTQDYGVAALALGKKARAVNQNGLIYSDGNIDKLLFERHLGQKVRRAGGRTSNPRKRTPEDDMNFEKAFQRMIETER
jgi:uncharacterized protein YaiI (UPF0178 family)